MPWADPQRKRAYDQAYRKRPKYRLWRRDYIKRRRQAGKIPSAAAYVRALRAQRKAGGLCVDCGHVKVSRFVRCGLCREVVSEQRKAQRRRMLVTERVRAYRDRQAQAAVEASILGA